MNETNPIVTSNITPGMIGHYRQLLSLRHENTDWLRGYSGFGYQLRAFTASHLFIIRFDHGYREGSTAYLSVVNGVAEWRYADLDCGYARCPVVVDPEAIRQLDEVFLRYYRQNRLPDVLSDDGQHLSERLAWLNEHFFSTGEVVDSTIVQDEDMIGELFCWDGVWEFLKYLSFNLGHYQRRFKLAWVALHNYPERLLKIRFGRHVRFVDVGMGGSLYLHLLLCLNEIFWPYFEIRRYRNGNTGPGGVLPILSVYDWNRLEQMHGCEAMDSKFERITPKTELFIPTDGKGEFIRPYNELLGL
ncbi:hypothetical protein GCM10007415_40010 [Parapedobacter pyrenivorans]|uniref:Uncharacterized protein n=1 Tax=Parapedobacter pyrenivorans TaxID=1305674 RepID=A0A917MDU3_9SPHI|nr:hypothetical protein [Parapedobacter pyrenivorans]GGH00101.1 hypothetical protein GCM10007415_40010 [Parapedobacter pyrenivorans]